MSEMSEAFWREGAKEYINKLSAKLDEANKEIEQHKAITEAAKFLVEVKNHKNTYGKTSWYLASKPIAWRKLEEAVDNLGEDNE